MVNIVFTGIILPPKIFYLTKGKFHLVQPQSGNESLLKTGKWGGVSSSSTAQKT